MTLTLLPAASAIVTLHEPDPTEVTVKFELGEPFVTVATAVLEDVAVQAVVPFSVTVTVSFWPMPVNFTLVGTTASGFTMST